MKKKKKKRKIKEKRRGGRQLIKLSVHRSSPTSVILRDENDTGEDHLPRIISFVSRSLKWTRSYTSKKKPKWVFAPSLLFFFLVGAAAVAVAVFIHTHTHSIYLYMSLDYQRCAWEKLPPRQLLLVGRRGCCNTAEFSDGRVRCCTHGKTFSFPSFSSDDHVKCCFCLD